MLSDKELDERIEGLCEKFPSYVAWTLESYRLDTPARYFHIKTVNRLKSHSDLASALRDDIFFDYLYATLVSWGMASRRAELCGFEEFRNTICSSRTEMEQLAEYSLSSLCQRHALESGSLVEVVKLMNDLLAKVRVSKTERWLVANTKALHHILPELFPPIDGNFTLRFFFDSTSVRTGAKSNYQFVDVFGGYLNIYECVSDQIQSMVDTDTFNSSSTKVIDNAIIGYVLSNLKT